MRHSTAQRRQADRLRAADRVRALHRYAEARRRRARAARTLAEHRHHMQRYEVLRSQAHCDIVLHRLAADEIEAQGSEE